MQRAGVAWDAVRVSAYVGEHVLPILGDTQGALIYEPYCRYFTWLVPPASTEPWPRLHPAVETLGSACWVDVPPAGRRDVEGVGPIWIREPDDGQLFTDPAVLRSALERVVVWQFGPREEASR